MLPKPTPQPMTDSVLSCDAFAAQELISHFRWFNEPQSWSFSEGRLRIEPDAPTDFWQRTHYGLQADNGHFLYRDVEGDFVLSTLVQFHPVYQYDQAGIMVRVSAGCWLKTSVEFEPSGPSQLGVVVTNYGYSDWSTQDFPPGASHIWLRVRREANDFIVDTSSDGERWSQLRIAHLHEGRGIPAACGVYACCPKGGGFTCEFVGLSIAPGRLPEDRS